MIPLSIITTVIAALGLALIAVMIVKVRALTGDRLSAFRAGDEAFADLLNAASMIDDGILLGKSGSLTAAWIYRADDAESSTNAQKELTSAHINAALARLGNGWMVHIDAVRRPSTSYPQPELSHFPDRLCEAIDAERRALFAARGVLFEGYYVLSVTYFAPKLTEQRFVELLYDDDSPKKSNSQLASDALAQFKADIANLESRLSSAIKMTRLRTVESSDEDGNITRQCELLRWLQFAVTGKNHPIALPRSPMFLDGIIGGEEFWPGTVPKLGKRFIQCIGIEGFPLESHPGMLTALSDLPIEYRWSTRFIFLDNHRAIADMEKFRRKWRQKIRGFMDQVLNSNSGMIDLHAASMVRDADQAIADINSGAVAMGYYTAVVVLSDEDREKVEKGARAIERAINNIGFTARVETVNTVEAYLGSIPGHGVENVRRPLLNTLNLSDLLPMSSIWTGEASTPCPMYPAGAPALMQVVTTGNSPFRLNLHVRDIGHTLILGPTGAGKSTLLAMMLLQARRYQGMRIFAFDKGRSMLIATKAVGGSHYEIGAAMDAGGLAFAPLSKLEDKSDLGWALEWIDTVLALNGLDTTPGQRNEIVKALLSMQKSGSTSLGEFANQVQDNKIREALDQYLADEAMGHLLDAQEDNLTLTDFATFEVDELMSLGERYALPVLLYLFRRIEKGLTGSPTLLVLDEAWLMLAHPVFREKIREWLKTLRKKNVAVIMATQNLSDASRSGILDVLVESSATRIFLPNVFAREEDATVLYHRMGLNSRQIEMIAMGRPKHDYYLVSERGRRMFSLALGPLAMSFVGATDMDSINEVRRLERMFGDGWVNAWLKQRGVAASV